MSVLDPHTYTHKCTCVGTRIVKEGVREAESLTWETDPRTQHQSADLLYCAAASVLVFAFSTQGTSRKTGVGQSGSSNCSVQGHSELPLFREASLFCVTRFANRCRHSHCQSGMEASLTVPWAPPRGHSTPCTCSTLVHITYKLYLCTHTIHMLGIPQKKPQNLK